MNTNYERRIKKILWRRLTNKLEKDLNRILKSIDSDIWNVFGDFLNNFKWLKDEEIRELNLNMASCIEQKSNINLDDTWMPVAELEFYDWYWKTFTDEENQIYRNSIEDNLNERHERAMIGFRKLMGEHGDFFRLRWNYLSSYFNLIVDKYDIDDVKKADFDLDTLEKDWEFLINFKNEIENLDKLKKWYIIRNLWDIDETRDYLLSLLGYLTRNKRLFILNSMIKNKDEAVLLKRLNEIIIDFDLDEFLKEAALSNTVFVDIYNKRTYGQWYKEDDMWPILEYLWKKYKKPDEFLEDDIEKIYRSIWVRKIKLDKIYEFHNFVITKKEAIGSEKSRVKTIFREALEFWHIPYFLDIYYNIGNETYQKKFKEALRILWVRFRG